LRNKNVIKLRVVHLEPALVELLVPALELLVQLELAPALVLELALLLAEQLLLAQVELAQLELELAHPLDLLLVVLVFDFDRPLKISPPLLISLS
jgi:hypothetical protein